MDRTFDWVNYACLLLTEVMNVSLEVVPHSSGFVALRQTKRYLLANREDRTEAPQQ